MRRIALVGDFQPSVVAHQAIPKSLELARLETGVELSWEWVGTESLAADAPARLAEFHGVWCVPASPYRSTEGALAAIRWARTTPRRFLGTCGGFQHALLEYAQNVWGLERAAHAELDPAASDPVIAPLECALVEVTGEVRLVPGSRVARAYGVEVAQEGYHCSYGVSPRYAARLESGPLRVSVRDAAGEVRAVELEGHPFFVATLFQPERRALRGELPPIVQAFVESFA